MANTVAKRNKKGFTLVELVIVIAILAILAAIAVPTVSDVIGTANTNTDATNCQTIELALKSADAEATAGTWSQNASALTVDNALKHEGLDLTTLQNGIKSNGGKKFYYTMSTATSGLGKIYVDNSSDRYALKSDTLVEDYLKGDETK